MRSDQSLGVLADPDDRLSDDPVFEEVQPQRVGPGPLGASFLWPLSFDLLHGQPHETFNRRVDHSVERRMLRQIHQYQFVGFREIQYV